MATEPNSLRESGRELLMRTFHAWRILLAGAIAGAIGLYIDISDADFPRRFWYALFITGVLAAAFQAFHEVRVERNRLQKLLDPKFELVFDPAKYRFCRDEETWDDADGTHVIERQFRVGVRNLSGVSVPNMRVMIRDVRPMPATGFIPGPLRRMEDLYPNTVSYQPFVLNPGPRGANPSPSVYVDVVRKRSAGNGSDYIGIGFGTMGRQSEKLAPGRYVLTIEAEGQDAPTVVSEFDLWVDHHGVLQFDKK